MQNESYEFVDEKPQEESIPGYIARTGARTLARAGESILDIVKSAADVSRMPQTDLQKALTKKIQGPEYPENAPRSIEDISPRETIKHFTGGKLEPHTPGEQAWDVIVGDIMPVFIGAPSTSIPKGLLTAFGKSGLSNFAKWGTESVTGSPLAGETAKLGTMALLGTAGTRKKVEGLKQESYKRGFGAIPEGEKFNIHPEKISIDKLAHEVSRGDMPYKDFISDRFRALSDITNKRSGKIDVNELIKLKQGWGKYLRDTPELDKDGRRLLGKGIDYLNKAISRYGKTNENFYQNYKIGEELTGALNGFNLAQKLFADSPYLQEKASNPLVKSLFGLGGAVLSGRVLGLPTAAAGLGAAYAGREAAKTIKLFAQSPIARHAYKKYAEAALQGNIPVAAKNLQRLNDAADKFTASEPEGFESAESETYELID